MDTQRQTQTEAQSYPPTPTPTPTHPPTQTQSQVSAYSLEHVSDGELHLGTRRLVGRSNQILAALLAHLGEIEARGIHRERCCASLHTYLVYELRMSEDAAFRRIAPEPDVPALVEPLGPAPVGVPMPKAPGGPVAVGCSVSRRAREPPKQLLSPTPIKALT